MLERLVERLAIALNANGQRDGGEKGDGPYFRSDIPEAVALEQDAPGDPHEVSQRHNFTNGLRPDRHAPEGEQISGKQDGGQKDEEGHLHGLKLVLRNGGKHDPQGEIGRDEDKSGDQQKRYAAENGHTEEKIGHE